MHHADALDVLRRLPTGSVDLIAVDPPFNTGRTQRRRYLRTRRAGDGDAGDRTGFGGRRYRSEALVERAFEDAFDDHAAFLAAHLEEARRVLAPTGSLYLHLDWRESARARLLGDHLFGRDAFLNEIVWAYDFGARPRDRWPAKHDTILVWARTPGRHHFDAAEVERIPYMAPGLVGPEKAARGKLPTDVWWHTIVSPTGKEKLGYPTQKPLGVYRRIVAASCPPGGLVADFFAGSGTTGAAALALERRFLLVDRSAEAVDVMRRRFADAPGVDWVPEAPGPQGHAPGADGEEPRSAS